VPGVQVKLSVQPKSLKVRQISSIGGNAMFGVHATRGLDKVACSKSLGVGVRSLDTLKGVEVRHWGF